MSRFLFYNRNVTYANFYTRKKSKTTKKWPFLSLAGYSSSGTPETGFGHKGRILSWTLPDQMTPISGHQLHYEYVMCLTKNWWVRFCASSGPVYLGPGWPNPVKPGTVRCVLWWATNPFFSSSLYLLRQKFYSRKTCFFDPPEKRKNARSALRMRARTSAIIFLNAHRKVAYKKFLFQADPTTGSWDISF